MTGAWLLLAAGWTLVGTVVAEPRSVAILEDEGGEQRVMREGDDLGECVVGRIARDEVVLACAGEARRLSLEASDDEPAIGVDAARTQARMVSLPGAAFRSLLADRQKLAGQVSLEPAVADGYVYGYRVAAIREDGDLAGFGIAPGDVITHVNGAPASEPGVFIQTIDALRGQTSFSLGVDRNGEHVAFTYVLE